MKEFLTNIFGHQNAAYWAAAMFFGLIGFVFYKWITYNPNSKKTSPNVFSWKYWISNNTSDMLGGTLTFFIWVRFKNEIFEAFNNDSVNQWLVSFTDTFFVHMMFGVLSIDIIRRVRKALKK